LGAPSGDQRDGDRAAIAGNEPGKETTGSLFAYFEMADITTYSPLARVTVKRDPFSKP
jgi:hypothetical protein